MQEPTVACQTPRPPGEDRVFSLDRARSGVIDGHRQILFPWDRPAGSPAEIGQDAWTLEPTGDERLARRREMTILVVEGEPTSARVLARELEKLGHLVLTATDGDQAWSILCRRRVSLVISDWTIPGIDGLELCHRIRGRRNASYTYFILVTGRSGDDDRLEGLRAGADDFLAKPLNMRELVARLEIARRILAMQDDLERKNAALATLATTDALTGLSNRRCFDEALKAHASLAVRRNWPLSLVLLDVDHFKAYNDAFGHPAGDVVLREIARILRSGARAHDVVARYGGEEFTVLLPATDAPAVLAFAERLRASIEAAEWPICPVTASFGVATLQPIAPDTSGLIERADKALYRSKRQGRNRISFADGLAYIT